MQYVISDTTGDRHVDALKAAGVEETKVEYVENLLLDLRQPSGDVYGMFSDGIQWALGAGQKPASLMI
jgi:hypothetical protein